MKPNPLALLSSILLAASASAQEPSPQILISGGEYRAFYPQQEADLTLEPLTRVEPFKLDDRPVTNAQFLAFVNAAPRWRRGTATPLLADAGYLRHWAGPLTLGPGVEPHQPVINVSWFAARAYCGAHGRRLPGEHEWEFVARADEAHLDASDDPDFLRRILDFYSRPRTGPLAPVASSAPNAWGAYDMHGLVWEWVEDFNASFLSGDNRQEGDKQLQRFCGGAALGAENVRDYATFMRFAFRSSLQAAYTVRSLGFRCADDAESP